jgi:hypothetical protein
MRTNDPWEGVTMSKWLGDCWQVISDWLRELGAAYVVDDGTGEREDKP